MKVVYGFFFIAISIYPTYAQSTQTAVRDFGGNIEITCSVMNVNFFPIAWFKFEKDDPTKTTVLSISNKLMVRNSKFSLRIHVENGTNNHILKIQNIQKTDIAIYRCVVMCDDANSDANTSADVELDVNRPPVISDASSPTLVNAMEGQFSRLECYADGFPEPRVTWTRENNGILTTGGNFYRGNVLRFYNVTKDDRGIYFCNIVNGIGGGVRRIIDFRVTFSPVITVSKIMYSHREPLKRNLDVQCLVEAYPTPKIEWLYNGVVLPNDNHDYKIMENTTAHQFAYSALTFLKIDNERIGKYTCKAQNTIGTAEVTAIAWKGNMDIQLLGEKSCALSSYITKYQTKPEKSYTAQSFDLINNTKSLSSKLWSLALRSLNNRECGSLEESDTLLSIPLFGTDSNTTIKCFDVSINRNRRLKPKKEILAKASRSRTS